MEFLKPETCRIEKILEDLQEEKNPFVVSLNRLNWNKETGTYHYSKIDETLIFYEGRFRIDKVSFFADNQPVVIRFNPKEKHNIISKTPTFFIRILDKKAKPVYSKSRK